MQFTFQCSQCFCFFLCSDVQITHGCFQLFINKQYSNDTISELVKKITRQQSLSIVQNNVAFQKLLTDGIDVEVKQKDGSIKTEKAYIFDAKDIENNEFLAINQYTVIENGKERRPDIVAFLNGIPVVVIELKNTLFG